jgi:hypothetical protein
VTDTLVVPGKISASWEQKLLPAISPTMSGSVNDFTEKMHFRKSNSNAGRKTPPLILRLPIPPNGAASILPSFENVNFEKIQRPSPKKQMRVTKWIKGSWNQPIKKLE